MNDMLQGNIVNFIQIKAISARIQYSNVSCLKINQNLIIGDNEGRKVILIAFSFISLAVVKYKVKLLCSYSVKFIGYLQKKTLL